MYSLPSDLNELKNEVKLYQELRFEQQRKPIINTENFGKDEMEKLLVELLPNRDYENPDEPSDLESIIKHSEFPELSYEVKDYKSRLRAALYARFAGCLLGVPVEGYSIERMEGLAKKGNMAFPPIDYWTYVEPADCIQYGVDRRGNYSKGNIDAVLVDDDITYTVLNAILLIGRAHV